jgi:hypothetical protein
MQGINCRTLRPGIRAMQAALDPFGDHPSTTEQTRIVQLLVERVDVNEDAIEARIRAEGIARLIGGTARAGR